MKSIHHHFHSPALGMFIIRLVAGVIFMFSAYMKLADMPMTIGFFATIGLGAFWAWLVAILELAGGLSLIIGIWTKFFSFFLSIIMIVAIYFTAKGGIEMAMAPLLLLAISVAVLFSGCGAYSVCRWNHKNCQECANGTCACGHGMKS